MTYTYNPDLEQVILDVLYDPLQNCGQNECVAVELTKAILAKYTIDQRHTDGRIELPREHDLAPKRWQLPSGEIITEAINHEALELLKTDPEEYFRRTRRPPPPIAWEAERITKHAESQTMWGAIKEVIRDVLGIRST